MLGVVAATRISMKMFVLTFSVFLMSISSAGASGSKTPCVSGMKNIYNSRLPGCYALVDPAKGLLTYSEAVSECRKIHWRAGPVIMGDKDSLADIARFAIDEGLPKGGKAGFWLGFFRRVFAPLDANGTLSAENAAIRKDRSRFHFIYHMSQFPVNPDLWRNDKQPGDQTDERDERCTAQKKPGKPKFLGMDDYPCEGYQLHYAVCVYL